MGKGEGGLGFIFIMNQENTVTKRGTKKTKTLKKLPGPNLPDNAFRVSFPLFAFHGTGSLRWEK
jgi:hypothetical protein